MMNVCLKKLTPLCVLSLAAGMAHGQFYKLHNVDLGANATGQFTTPLTQGNSNVTQRTTNSFGGLFSLREHPFAFAGVEFNYGYSEFSEVYNTPTYSGRTQTDAHEATAAYLFHPHFFHLQPFVGVGGGAIDFVPRRGKNQWRSAGLVEVGFDIPTSNPHFGFKVQGRSLIYRDPNYFQSELGSKTWVATTEPSFGTYYRF